MDVACSTKNKIKSMDVTYDFWLTKNSIKSDKK